MKCDNVHILKVDLPISAKDLESTVRNHCEHHGVWDNCQVVQSKNDEICRLLDKAYFALTMDDWGGNKVELAKELGSLRYSLLPENER